MIKGIMESDMRGAMEQYHTLKEAAAALGISESTASRWCRKYGLALLGTRHSQSPRPVEGFGDLTAKQVLMAIIQDDYRPADRECLKCHKPFASVSPAFRICPQCRPDYQSRGGVVLDERRLVKHYSD